MKKPFLFMFVFIFLICMTAVAAAQGYHVRAVSSETDYAPADLTDAVIRFIREEGSLLEDGFYNDRYFFDMIPVCDTSRAFVIDETEDGPVWLIPIPSAEAVDFWISLPEQYSLSINGTPLMIGDSVVLSAMTNPYVEINEDSFLFPHSAFFCFTNHPVCEISTYSQPSMTITDPDYAMRGETNPVTDIEADLTEYPDALAGKDDTELLSMFHPSGVIWRAESTNKGHATTIADIMGMSEGHTEAHLRLVSPAVSEQYDQELLDSILEIVRGCACHIRAIDNTSRSILSLQASDRWVMAPFALIYCEDRLTVDPEILSLSASNGAMVEMIMNDDYEGMFTLDCAPD